MHMATFPLAGIRVLELTTGAAGPTAGRTLGEFGADVIRIESRKRLDNHRGQDPKRWNQRPDFIKLNRGKRSLTIDLGNEKGRALVRALVPKCDVVIENYALGVLERWGLDYPHLKQLRDDIILVRVKGLGSTGPHATDVTWGPNVGNIMGSTYLWNYPDAHVPTGEARSQHPDFMGGVTAAYAVVLALLERSRTGKGQWIDIAQLEVGASLLGPRYLEYSVNGRAPQPVGNASVVAAPYGAYRCRGEDRWCVIGVYTQGEWERLCRVLGYPEWACEGKFATHLGRVRHKTALDRCLEEWTRERDPYEVMETLQAAGVMAAVVQDVEDQFKHDKQYAARDFLTKVVEPEIGELVCEGIAVHLSETPGRVRGPAPRVGEHTHEVLHELLDLSDKEIQALEAEGVLY